MSLAESSHRDLNSAFFERDLLRNERVMGRFRRSHVRALGKALSRREPGRIEPVTILEDADPQRIDREFIRQRKPLVIRGGAKAWTAAKLWSFDFFAETFGDMQVSVADEHFSRTKEGLGYRIALSGFTMKRFVEEVKNGHSIYLKFFPVFKLHPELRDHLDLAAMTRWSKGRVARGARDKEI
jgi:hypothetical protein